MGAEGRTIRHVLGTHPPSVNRRCRMARRSNGPDMVAARRTQDVRTRIVSVIHDFEAALGWLLMAIWDAAVAVARRLGFGPAADDVASTVTMDFMTTLRAEHAQGNDATFEKLRRARNLAPLVKKKVKRKAIDLHRTDTAALRRYAVAHELQALRGNPIANPGVELEEDELTQAISAATLALEPDVRDLITDKVDK